MKIYPDYNIDITQYPKDNTFQISYTFSSNVYIYGSLNKENKREVYLTELKKEYKALDNFEESLSHFKRDFRMFGIQFIRFGIPSENLVDSKGNKLFTYIGTYTDMEIINKELI